MPDRLPLMNVVALAGGIGAARFLRGLVRATDPADLTVVVNTGDDIRLHGLHISPDLDTITYTLGGGIHPQQGWGREGETFTTAHELRDRYGRPDWFTLGDRDLATHLVRSEILADGGTLTDATAAIATAWRLPFTLLPMTDAPVATMIQTTDDRTMHFQRWWVGERAATPAARVWLDGATDAQPAAGVLEAIAEADLVVLCPSNPVVSIGTILQVPGIRAALKQRHVVGVSPIVGGAVVRGMADKLLPAVGASVSADGVARTYGGFLDGWVIDLRDAELADGLRDMGLTVAVTDTMMVDVDVTTALAQTVLDLAP
ncbi:2-phospho-L-lactate transferase [soil metagenome]